MIVLYYIANEHHENIDLTLTLWNAGYIYTACTFFFLQQNSNPEIILT